MSNLLFDTLPYLYSLSKEVEEIQGAIDSERLVLENKVRDLYEQLFVESSDWSLSMWEKMLGMKNLSAKSSHVDYQPRRENILARLRSKGVSSKKSLEELCRSFSGGDVKILEDNSNYSFCLKEVKASDSYTHAVSGEFVYVSYYKVKVFFRLDLPVLGDIFTFPVTGQTKAIYYAKD